MQRLRTPAFRSAEPTPAPPLDENPAALLERFYEKVWREQMADLPFVNPALAVAAVGFRRHEGDWVGALVTPWCVNLFLLPGGGTLWRDLPSGEQRKVVFPVGELDFIADNNPNPQAPITAYQYCPLIHPVQHIVDQATALAAAEAALAALFSPPPEPAATPEAPPAPEPPRDRRAFLRGLVGKRD